MSHVPGTEVVDEIFIISLTLQIETRCKTGCQLLYQVLYVLITVLSSEAVPQARRGILTFLDETFPRQTKSVSFNDYPSLVSAW